jgi:primosomal protein DnaI
MEKINIKFKYEENSKKELDKMYKDYLNYKPALEKISELKIPEEKVKQYIVRINDYVSDLKYCSKCPGLDKCKKDNPHVVRNISYTKGVVDRSLSPCPRIIESIELEKQFLFKDYEQGMDIADLRKLDKSNARNEAMFLVKQYMLKKSNRWIFLNGATNTGRSFLSAAIANEFARRKIGPISFINTANRLKEINDLSYSNKEEFEHIIKQLSSAKLLILDDFGNEYKNDFIRDGIVFQILSSRAKNHLLTIFTSDFSIDEIVTLYETSKAGTIRAKQIGQILKDNAKKEISLGTISIY